MPPRRNNNSAATGSGRTTKASTSKKGKSRQNSLVDVASILADLKHTSALGKQLEQAVIWERWPDIAGQSLYIHGRPHSIRDGCLRIEAESSVWLNKFTFRKADILRRIRQIAPEAMIEDLFLLLVEDGEELEQGPHNAKNP